MKFQHRFRKIYVRVKEEGYEPNAIICLGKRGYEQEWIPGTTKTIISKYEYKLLIDLFLVRFKIIWIKRDAKAQIQEEG